MIYAIEAVGLRRVKLGYSKSEHTFVWRYQSVDTHCPTEINVIGVWREASKQDERRLHATWQHAHFKGEWFQLTPELETFIEECFSPFKVTKEMRTLALLLRSQKEAEIPLLLDDERFVSFDDANVHYEAGQEAWVIASEETEVNTRGILKRSHHPEEVFEIVHLRSEGHSFREIAEKVGKSTNTVQMAWRRSREKKA